jgi:sucrose-6F-phosphate phosphohydrolase
METILLCSDLDRTLIPNGDQDESPHARMVFSHLADHPSLRLAYVSGRDKNLIKEAIRDYDLPDPDFVIGDVGTSLYDVVGGRWLRNKAWHSKIGQDWYGYSHDDITDALADMAFARLELQEPQKQNRYKISYYTSPSVDPDQLKSQILVRLDQLRVLANLIWSRDDARDQGLLDILPRRANKLNAIRFLMTKKMISDTDTVFAGDSGNDLDVLTSGLQSILVKNASEDVRQTTIEKLTQKNQANRLYMAKGKFLGMNGNYAAGVLEGLVHFFPETTAWVSSAVKTMKKYPE